jgi:hypothetical protein
MSGDEEVIAGDDLPVSFRCGAHVSRTPCSIRVGRKYLYSRRETLNLSAIVLWSRRFFPTVQQFGPASVLGVSELF